MSRYPARRSDSGGRSTVFGTRGAVVCEHPLAALAGIRTLENGGNAADACVAMAASMTVLAPMMTGMGGDAFLLFYEAETGHGRSVNGSGRASRSVAIEKLRSRGVKEMPERGALTVTVPGAVRFWEVSETLLLGNEAARTAFLPEGRAPRPGELFYQEDLARTLAAVAENGADAFYTGEIAGSIARSVREAGGYLDEEDLAAHETLWVEPIHTDYRGVRVYEIPPPSQGIAALQMLNVLEGFDFASLEALSAERIHLEAEAKKLAFRDLHERIGDPEFEEIPIEELLSKDYATHPRENISPTR